MCLFGCRSSSDLGMAVPESPDNAHRIAALVTRSARCSRITRQTGTRLPHRLLAITGPTMAGLPLRRPQKPLVLVRIYNPNWCLLRNDINPNWTLLFLLKTQSLLGKIFAFFCLSKVSEGRDTCRNVLRLPVHSCTLAPRWVIACAIDP